MSEELYNAYHEKITLTKEQEGCLNYSGSRTLMVKGVAGAGKSLIIQALAKKLLAGYSADKHHKVAIFTFSNTLNSATREFLQINGEQEDYITVTTLDSYINQVYKEMKGPHLKIYSGNSYTEIRKEVMQIALENHKKACGPHRFQKLDLQFWLDEIDWMKDMNVSVEDMNYYLGLQRKGRDSKVRMTAADRVAAFQIFTQYEKEMKRRGMGAWVDYALYLIRNADRIPDQLRFDHILIDEAQDLSLAQMRAAMVFCRKDMVIAMDMNQRIFNKQWTPKLLGIEATTKKLTKSMRTTKQIDDLAESLRRHNDEFLDEEDKSVRAIPENEGPVPRVVHLEDFSAEKKYVIEQIRAWLKQKANISIGIIAAKNALVKTYAAWMTDAGIKHEIIQKDSVFSMAKPGVKIVNAFNAKGLEFTRVLIPQFIEGNFPYAFNSPDEAEQRDFLIKCRNLIYVAMTRAKFSLMITYSGNKGSRFIGEMNADFYNPTGDITYIKPLKQKTNLSQTEKSNSTGVELPPMAEVSHPASEGKSLKEYLQAKGLEVIDKRDAGGALWVVGEKSELVPVLKEVASVFGAYGKFSAGGRATGQRPGWFTQCKK